MVIIIILGNVRVKNMVSRHILHYKIILKIYVLIQDGLVERKEEWRILILEYVYWIAYFILSFSRSRERQFPRDARGRKQYRIIGIINIIAIGAHKVHYPTWVINLADEKSIIFAVGFLRIAQWLITQKPFTFKYENENSASVIFTQHKDKLVYWRVRKYNWLQHSWYD